MQHLDQKALADRWQVSPRTLEQWRWQGRGPRYLKIGGRVIYRRQDVEAFEAANIHANTVGPIGDSHEDNPLGRCKAGGGWTARCPAHDDRDGGGE
jgi:Helix-turn-helix domain